MANAFAADTEVIMAASEEGVTWQNAPWSSGVPAADITALINIGDADNAFLIEGEAITGNLTLQNNTYVLLTGEGNSLTTTFTGAPYGDLKLNNNSIFVLSNGAELTIANGMSVHGNDNSQFIVDNATFTGALYSKANHVEIRNGATWNVKGYSNGIHQANLSVTDSTMVSQSGFGMGSGYTEANKKIFNLENSTWQMGGNGANFSGRVNVLDSAITSTGHLNVGAENGQASGENTLFMQGSTAENLSTMTAYKLWWNTNGGDTSSTLHQAGNTDITISNAFDSSNNTNGGGNVLWLFSGDNNTFQSNGGDSTWGDNNKGVNTTGVWKITSAQSSGGGETFATNSLFKVNTIHLRASSVDGNDFQSVVDWAGESNTFRTSYDVRAFLSTGAGSDSLTSFTVRDGALADIGSYVIVGADAGISGTASFNILNGATYNQKYHLVLQNSSAEGSEGQSLATIDNATWNRTAGNVLIGVGTNPRNDNPNLNAVSGTAILAVKNSTVDFGGNIRIAASNVDPSTLFGEHSNVSKFVVHNSTFTMNGEFYMGYGDGTTYAGTAIIEVSGENSSLISTKKGFWNGYNSSNAGADFEVNILGKNNTIAFEGSEGGNHSFYMNSAGSGTQNGGSFKVDMQGEGNLLKVRSFQIGRTNATGGSNTVYSKGSSASNKNQILLIDENINIRGGAEDSTIANTFHLDGNTVLARTEDRSVNVNLATDAVAGGTASFIVSGVNNEVYAYNFNMGNTSSTGGRAIFEIDGSTHIISIANEFNFRAADPSYSTLSFVADAFGVSTIEAERVQTFSGLLEIDFTKYLAETLFETPFTLITANNYWEVAQDYLTTENNEYVNVIKANEDDTWEIVQEGNDLLLYYTSSTIIPEPSTCAALFGAIALAFAAYRRRK